MNTNKNPLQHSAFVIVIVLDSLAHVLVHANHAALNFAAKMKLHMETAKP